MLLAVRFGPAGENMCARFECRWRVPEHVLLWRNDKISVRSGDSRIGYRHERIYIDGYLLYSFSSKHFAGRNHDRDRHSLKMHLAICKQRLIRNDPADLIFTEDILCSN